MTTIVKQLLIKPIISSVANKFVKLHHYSKKVVPNSNIHFGVFSDNKLSGVMQFGSPINKKGTINLVKDTEWYGMIELNRMVFLNSLPKNSESRTIAISMKLIKKHYPKIEWVVSFADGTQCGDGTIYRASGFVLTAIRENTAIRINPNTGEAVHVIQAHHKMITKEFKHWKATKGYQLRYVYFINSKARKRLTVPIIPFSQIKEMGASMYKGVRVPKSRASDDQLEKDGANPIHSLQN